MNSSRLKEAARHYLSMRKIPEDPKLDDCMSACFAELARMDPFRAVSAFYEERPAFLLAPAYADFLKGAEGYLLLACTLGVEVDRKLRRLSVTDLSRMVVFDACANAYLEACAEEYKKSLSPELSYTFCPGYGGSALSDLDFIFAALKPARIGIELTEAHLMIPQKSMAGVAVRGVSPKMQCGSCVKIQDCVFRKEGTRCFRSEEN